MIECPNCGSNLKFDIATQDMCCEHCDSHFDPYAFDNKTEDAIEQDYFEATIFTCPQCGGELMGTDNAAATFCSFCGASTILHSRISKSKRPKYILPFTKTKEDCKEEYIKKAKKAIFAPDELKKEEFIESFRGIYMPYWFYEITQKGSCSIDGEDSYRRGDYIITEHYDLMGIIDASYNGINYDAASSFTDDISRKVAPFDIKVRNEFTPAFFSGFYADTADVDSSLYADEAINTAFIIASNEIECIPEFDRYSIDWNDEKNGPETLKTKLNSAQLAMFPVWFMAYRNKDRVTYATVNGQTGKVVADFPVDIKKYLIGSAVLTLPLFILFNMLFTFKPMVVMFIVAIISLIANGMFFYEITNLVRKENYEQDKGKSIKKSKLNFTVIINGKTKIMRDSSAIVAIVCICLVVLVFVMIFAIAFLGIKGSYLVLTACGLGLIIANYNKMSKLTENRKAMGLYLMIVAFFVSAFIAFVEPVSDLFYYGAAIFLMVSVLIVIINIIEYYNLLATRKLPQFDRQGGDDRA